MPNIMLTLRKLLGFIDSALARRSISVVNILNRRRNQSTYVGEFIVKHIEMNEYQ